jgi:DNA-binding NtrC family response regulator
MGEIDFQELQLPPVAGDETFGSPPKPPRLQPPRFDRTLSDAVSGFEKDYIEHLLKENQWHRSRVAGLLGIDRRTLFRKIKAYGL